MSKVTLRIWNGENGDISFEGANVSEVLAMRAEYLLNVGVEEVQGEGPSAPATTFLSRTKGEVT